MKLISVISNRRRSGRPRMAAVAGFLAVLVPLSLAAAGSPASAARASGTAPAASAASGSAACPWLNQSLTVSQRTAMLLAKMTLADKINMVTGAGTSSPYVFYITAIPSLCIPALGQEDGPNGVGDGLTGVTQLPAGVSLAATFDT